MLSLHDVIVKYLDGRDTVKWNRCADVKYGTKKWYVEKLGTLEVIVNAILHWT